MRRIVSVSLAICLALLFAGSGRADEQAKALIDKAIKAHGGLDKLTKHKGVSLKMKGKVHVMGGAFDYSGDWWFMDPDKFKFTIDVDVMGMKIQQTQVVNGDKGWTWNSAENATKELEKEHLEEAREEFYAEGVESLAALGEKGFTLSALGEAKVGDRPAVGIRVSSKGHRDINLYFDKETSLLLKSERNVKDFMAGGKEVSQETLYQDYKEAEGTKYGSKMVIKRDGMEFVTAEVIEYKLHDKLDDSLFVKP